MYNSAIQTAPIIPNITDECMTNSHTLKKAMATITALNGLLKLVIVYIYNIRLEPNHSLFY